MPRPQHATPILSPDGAAAVAVGLVLSAAALLGAPLWLVLGGAWASGLWVVRRSLVARRALHGRVARVTDEADRLAGSVGVDRNPSELFEHPLERAAQQIAGTKPAFETRINQVEREQRDLRAVIEAVDSPVLATDADGVIRLCNAAGQSLFGSASNPRGRLIEQVFTQPEVLVIHARALRGEHETRRLRIALADGRVCVFEVTAAPAVLSAGDLNEFEGTTTGVVLTLVDVTELATAMQLKTDFVANASHELRTPLASIRAAAETLGSLGPEDETMRMRVLGMLERNAARLEEMVRDLLDLARLESPEAEIVLKDVHLGELASQLAALYEGPCAERNLELRFELGPDVGTVRTDPTLLKLILRNLLENAIKFARTETQVVAKLLTGGERSTLSALRIEVIDQGPGIPLSAQQRIFERFYQVDPSRTGHTSQRGTGLGLAIVKHAVRALEGRVWVESVYGEGTTMLVELPVHAGGCAVV